MQTVCRVDIPPACAYTSSMEKHAEDHRVFYEEVGRRIRDARRQRKPILTQDGLGKLVGLTRTSITNVERGRQKCLLHTLADIALALHVEVASLIPPMTAEFPELDDAIKDRPASEKMWIRSTVAAAQRGRNEHGA